MPPETERFERLTRRWLDLAERRLAHYEELYRNGRWRHYYATEELFARRMLDVLKAIEVLKDAVAKARGTRRLRSAA
jgi:hypothetical protein